MKIADEFAERKLAWTPPARPDWVQRINDEGRFFDLRGVIPLHEDSLIDTAQRNTGLSDFGDDHWREPFSILARSLDEEGELNLIGRLMVRQELLLNLQGRLMIEDAYTRHPEIEDEQISKPFVIVGQPRTGTSALQNLLSKDPNNGTTPTWETMFPCPPSEKASYGKDWRAERADGLTTMYTRVVPELSAMHEFSGDVPTETIQLDCLSFRSFGWFTALTGQAPAYAHYMASQDDSLIFAYQKRVLKLLQWKNPRKNWVLKSPIYLQQLPALLAAYPDAGIIWTHRDPLKAMSSAINILGCQFWMRSDRPFIGDAMVDFTNADKSAAMLTRPIEWLEDGTVPPERICNIPYYDFVENPMGVAERIYDHFNVDLTPEGRSAMADYMQNFPRSSRPKHDYKTQGGATHSKERAAYARYQAYFDVPSEV